MSKKTQTKTTIGVTPSQDVKSPPAPVTPPPALIVPEAFTAHDKSLSPEQLRFSIELGTKFPAIVQEAQALKTSAAEVDASLARMGQKYYGFCSELRKAKMNRRESTLLLKGLGFAKTRVSEILKVSEVDDALWAKFANNQIGFKATLALGRGDGEAEEGEGEDGAKPEAGKKKKEKRLPKEFQPGIVAQLEDWGDSLKETSQKEPYVMRYENKDKRVYVVTIQPIDPQVTAKT